MAKKKTVSRTRSASSNGKAPKFDRVLVVSAHPDDPEFGSGGAVAKLAKDGAKVPVFVVRRKDMQLNGANPTLLHGYGGFNHSAAPFYLGSYVTFVNRALEQYPRSQRA